MGRFKRTKGYVGPNSWTQWTELACTLDWVVASVVCETNCGPNRGPNYWPLGPNFGPKYWLGWTEILARVDRIVDRNIARDGPNLFSGKPNAQIPRTHVYLWDPSSWRNCYTSWTEWLDQIGLPRIRSTNWLCFKKNSVHELKWVIQRFGPWGNSWHLTIWATFRSTHILPSCTSAKEEHSQINNQSVNY